MASRIGREPRIIDAKWNYDNYNSENYPEIVIIGKGVVFDTGGLNIKSGSGMRNMKKDMSGSAQALALALLIIENKLPIKLRLLLPIVENSIDSNALRPGDVITARNGKTTEITNTDAEGRLILADALVAATEGNPSLIIDFATLTGAARVALGYELPALFSNNRTELVKLWELSETVHDPLWLLPIHEPYKVHLKSNVADLINTAEK